MEESLFISRIIILSSLYEVFFHLLDSVKLCTMPCLLYILHTFLAPIIEVSYLFAISLNFQPLFLSLIINC